MSLGIHESRVRHRRRIRWTITKWVVVLSGITGAGVYAYQGGTNLALHEVTTLKEQAVALTAKAEDLQKRNIELQANVILAEQRLSDAQKRYDTDIPRGRMAALLGRIKDKLNDGVDESRLEFLIEAANNPRVCDENPVVKRFLVQTPLFKGANDSVSFAENAITITAFGEPAANDDGAIEAWFDPSQAISLRLTQIGGKTTVKTGKLPLHAAIVVADNEYRYSVTTGARGFVTVSGDRCQYP